MIAHIHTVPGVFPVFVWVGCSLFGVVAHTLLRCVFALVVVREVIARCLNFALCMLLYDDGLAQGS